MATNRNCFTYVGRMIFSSVITGDPGPVPSQECYEVYSGRSAQKDGHILPTQKVWKKSTQTEAIVFWKMISVARYQSEIEDSSYPVQHFLPFFTLLYKILEKPNDKIYRAPSPGFLFTL